jgi:hypothetical protein
MTAGDPSPGDPAIPQPLPPAHDSGNEPGTSEEGTPISADAAGTGAPPPTGDTTSSALPDISDPGVEKLRSWTGLMAVVAGDVAIAVAAIIGIVFSTRQTGHTSVAPQIVAILSSGFTAIGTLTTAYLGIKGIANAAQNIAGPLIGTPQTPGQNSLRQQARRQAQASRRAQPRSTTPPRHPGT